MVKTSYGYLFAEHRLIDKIREWWKETIYCLSRKLEILPVGNMLGSDIHRDNILAELESKMGKTDHSFQRVLTQSLNKS